MQIKTDGQAEAKSELQCDVEVDSCARAQEPDLVLALTPALIAEAAVDLVPYGESRIGILVQLLVEILVREGKTRRRICCKHPCKCNRTCIANHECRCLVPG